MKNPEIHEYENYVPDLTRPPVEEDAPQNTLKVRREDLPKVHTVHAIPHIHLTDATGEDYAVHAMAGDSPRELVLMGLHYMALGMALREQLGMGWDEPWRGPHPEGMPGWQEGNHSHD
jgi:hypothetical protein